VVTRKTLENRASFNARSTEGFNWFASAVV